MQIDAQSAKCDKNGRLWSLRMDGYGKATGETRQPSVAPAFDWHHLCSDAPEAAAWLRDHHGFDNVVIDTLTAIETRPKTFPHNDGVLLVLRGVNTNPGADPEDMVSLRVWFDRTQIITARKRERRLLSVQDLKASIEAGEAPTTTGELAIMLIERLANRISDVVDSVDDEITGYETGMIDMPMAEARRRLADTRRQTASIRRYLAPQRDALDNLYRERELLSDEEAFELRNQSDRTTRYIEEMDLARERTLVLQEELQNRIAEQQNARMYVLSMVAAVFLPLSFLTGVFGMNVAGLPGLENPSAFLILTLGMGVVAAGVIAVMRWKHWL